MTSATSLILIAVGAILAFAVSLEVAGISVKTVGAILIVVGGIGLVFAMVTLIGYAPWGGARTGAAQSDAKGTSSSASEPTAQQAPVRPPADA